MLEISHIVDLEITTIWAWLFRDPKIILVVVVLRKLFHSIHIILASWPFSSHLKSTLLVESSPGNF